MARRKGDEEQEQMNFDALYCSEETCGDEEKRESVNLYYINGNVKPNPSPVLLQQDLSWEDDELSSLLSKESDLKPDPLFLTGTRRDAAEWILGVTDYYSFSAATALLAVNYLDRFFSSIDSLGKDRKPWMTQLAAVACLSLAAKVEETHVPLLLDLQATNGSKFTFESKTIQRMEILILSTLQWRMNPITPLSFLDYITRRLGLKDYLCWEFLRRCELTILSLISDARFMSYLPSVMATATALHIISNVAPSVAMEYRDQLLGMFKANKDNVAECSEMIMELASSRHTSKSNKRKFGWVPGSPDGVIDVSFSSESSNDLSTTATSSQQSSVTSSPQPISKKSKSITLQDHKQLHISPSN